MKNKGPLYVLTCYAIWGLLPIFWKLLAQVDSLYVLASRIVWSMVLTGGILLLRRDRLAGVRAAFRDRREWGLLAAAGCVVCVQLGRLHLARCAERGPPHARFQSRLLWGNGFHLAILLGAGPVSGSVARDKGSSGWRMGGGRLDLREELVNHCYPATGRAPWIATGCVVYRAAALGCLRGALKEAGPFPNAARYSTFVETLTLAPFALAADLSGWRDRTGAPAPPAGSSWSWAVAAAAGVPVVGWSTVHSLMCFAAGMKDLAAQ